MNFKAGDKVVCVDDSPSRGYRNPGSSVPVQAGEVYCVSETHDDHPYAVRLVGIEVDDPSEYLLSSRFRLVSEVKLVMEAVNRNAIGREVETHTVAKP